VALELDTQPIGDSIHEGEVRDDRTRIMDSTIVKTNIAQPLHVLRCDGRRFESEPVGVIQQRSFALRQHVRSRETGADKPLDQLIQSFRADSLSR